MEMKICSKCGASLPKTTKYFHIKRKNKDGLQRECIRCVAEYNKQYREKNKESLAERKRQYSQTHKEHIKAYKQSHYEANKDSIAEYQKQYYLAHKNVLDMRNAQYSQEHKEALVEYRKEYYETYKAEITEKNKKWAQANKDRINAISRRRDAKKRQLPATLTHEQWQATKAHFNNRCAYCGRKLKLTQEHFIPLNKGGAYTQDNIIPACSTCNSSKQDKDFAEWYPKYKYYSEERANFIICYLNSFKEG